MLALLLPLLNSIAGGIITPFVKAWSDYKVTQLKINGAAFTAGAEADAAIMQTVLTTEVANNALKVVRTRLRCERWPLNGFAFFIVVGKPGHHTTRRHTSTRSSAAARHYSTQSWSLQKILDSLSQGVT